MSKLACKADKYFKDEASKMLTEIDEIRGPGPRLIDWNIRASALCVFIAIANLNERRKTNET